MLLGSCDMNAGTTGTAGTQTGFARTKTDPIGRRGGRGDFVGNDWRLPWTVVLADVAEVRFLRPKSLCFKS